MPSPTKSDPGAVLCRVTDNNSESGDALDQEIDAAKERITALEKRSGALHDAQPLPMSVMDTYNLFLKRLEILNDNLAAVQDLLRLLAKYD